MQNVLKACLAVLVLALTGGCNNSKLYGRLIGFLVDGVTGSRLNAFPKSGDLNNLGDDANATNQVFALIQGKFKRAEPCGQGDINAQNLIAADGCFKFENVPTNTDIPVFAQYAGYARFHGKTRIDTVATSVTDISDADPQKIGNIRLWPEGFQEDYSILVTSSNRPVANATIECQPSTPGANTFSAAGSDFITAEATTLSAVNATTATDGTATLAGSSLAPGAFYNCFAYTVDEFEGRTAQSNFTFTAGVTHPIINVAIATSGTASVLYAVRSNNDISTALFGSSGSMTVTLNRPAEFVPNTTDCQSASLSDPNTDGDATPTGALPAETLNNNASETADVSLSADGLTLTVAHKAFTTAVDPDDFGASVTFNGIFLRAKEATLQRSFFRIGSVASNGSTSCGIANAYGAPPALSNARTGGSQSNTINLF